MHKIKQMKEIGSIIALISIILFSSCASQKNGVAIKRKYNKGYYFAHNHKKTSESERKSNEGKIKITAEKSNVAKKAEDFSIIKPLLVIPTAEKIVVKKVDKISEVKHNTILVEEKAVTASVGETKLNLRHKVIDMLNNKKTKTSKGGDIDDTTILLIVFCFFPILSLIAMYLHDGKEITLNFWVDLLLYLTFIGWIVFGVLVVLDIVNLA